MLRPAARRALQVAAGEPLPITQEQLRRDGHAIEVCLCAEDPARGFLPQSGTLALWHAPTGLRVDHALRSGADIPPAYDSMIAKLVAHGRTRDEARRRLCSALQDLVALGVTTNQVFLRRSLEHPEFAFGDATTAFVGAHGESLLAPNAAAFDCATAVAAVMLLETDAQAQRGSARSLSHGLALGLRFALDGEPWRASVTGLGGHLHRVLAGEHEVELLHIDAQHARVLCDGIVEGVAWARDGPRLLLHLDGHPYTVVDSMGEAARRANAGDRDGRLRASTAGRVLAVRVAVDEQVAAGQALSHFQFRYEPGEV